MLSDLKTRVIAPLFQRRSSLFGSQFQKEREVPQLPGVEGEGNKDTTKGARSVREKECGPFKAGHRTSGSAGIANNERDSSIAVSKKPESIREEEKGVEDQKLGKAASMTGNDILEGQKTLPNPATFYDDEVVRDNPRVTVEEPTPEPLQSEDEGHSVVIRDEDSVETPRAEFPTEDITPLILPEAIADSAVHSVRPRKRSVRVLIEGEHTEYTSPAKDYFGSAAILTVPEVKMPTQRKIWVKRPNASATLVTVNEDDLVDDVREMILKKYANSLGRTFDAPDVTLRILSRANVHRQSQVERTLGPEESMCKTLDHYFPGGQKVEEALVIDVPQRRTPRHSPRVHIPYGIPEDIRPGEHDRDYFPQMPVAGGFPSPHLPTNVSIAGSQASNREHHSAMSILSGSGQVPPLPSPRGDRGMRQSAHRPKYGRNNTSSPTIAQSPMPQIDASSGARPMMHTSAAALPPILNPLPTPPAPSSISGLPMRTGTPPPRVSSPRPSTKSRLSKSKKATAAVTVLAVPSPFALDTSVPPINVLIVEDNIINLRLLEAFMKRLKVRWHTAMNGRDAVTKWREGGFHLVLMDIQLPVMNGLDATKEIRRLEGQNSIGVLAGGGVTGSSRRGSNVGGDAAGESAEVGKDGKREVPEGDKLANTELFKSPVIIVALTASSLQSDRHEALAAGCNDFLTKPVRYDWLERKVMEWGCMQALIDFDGWRKWKDFSSSKPTPATHMPGINSRSGGRGFRGKAVKKDDDKAKGVNGSPTMGAPSGAAATVAAVDPNANSAIITTTSATDDDDSDAVRTATIHPLQSPSGSTPATNPSSFNGTALSTEPHSPTIDTGSLSGGGGVAAKRRRVAKRSSLGTNTLGGVVEDITEGEGLGLGMGQTNGGGRKRGHSTSQARNASGVVV